MFEKNYLVKDLSCSHCVNKIQNALKSVKGVKSEVSLENKTILVKSNKSVNSHDIINAVARAGYTATEI